MRIRTTHRLQLTVEFVLSPTRERSSRDVECDQRRAHDSPFEWSMNERICDWDVMGMHLAQLSLDERHCERTWHCVVQVHRGVRQLPYIIVTA
jgi:hypothetical protein